MNHVGQVRNQSLYFVLSFILLDWAMFRTTRQIACKYYVLYHAWFATTQPCLAAEILHKCSPGYVVLICLCQIYKIPQTSISKLPTSFRWPQTNWFHSVAIASLKTATIKANLHWHWLNFFADSYQPHFTRGKTRPKMIFFYVPFCFRSLCLLKEVIHNSHICGL